MDLTFLIPTRIESEYRLRNLTTVLGFLLSNFDAKILVKEVDQEKIVEKYVLPVIFKKFGTIPDRLTYIHEKPTENFFHKTRILNDLIEEADTEVVCNYDTDVILPVVSISAAYELIFKDMSDAVYPYAVGPYQKAVNYSEEMYDEFFNTAMGEEDISILEKDFNKSNSTVGWCQFIRRENYIDSYMMNENFKAWGPEDCELHYRLLALGNRVDRLHDCVYHLEHPRSQDSWFSNPEWEDNTKLWNWIRTLGKQELKNYYQEQDYVKRRILNASV